METTELRQRRGNVIEPKVVQHYTQPKYNATPINKDTLIQQLYDTAYSCVDFIYQREDNKKDPELHNYDAKVISLVDCMHTAKNNGITEDYMGKYAYQKHTSAFFHVTQSQRYLPLVFSCLKKYMTTNNPTDHSQTPHPFAQKIVNLITTHDQHTLRKLPDCLYDNQDIFPLKDSSYMLIPSFETFYRNAVIALDPKYISPSSIHVGNVYNTLQLIEGMKKTYYHFSQDKAVGRMMLIRKKQPSMIGKLLGYTEEDYPITTKNIIAAACALVEKYNTARGDKKNPTGNQYCSYYIIINKELALPDDFNLSLFSADHYAFNELSDLSGDLVNLLHASPEDVQKIVDEHYAQ
jgi:hypothetical protein